MKKNLLAIAVISSVAGLAQAQSSVTIYGIVDAGVSYNSKVGKADGSSHGVASLDSGNEQASRLGFIGSEDLGGGMKAVFTLESRFSVDTGVLGQGGRLFGGTATVGLTDGFGTVLLGRQKDFIDDLSIYTSVVPFGVIVNNVHAINLDRTEGSRVNNSIRYNSPNINGFTASAIYGFGETAGQISTGQSLGLGGNYVKGPFGIGLAYFQAKLGTFSGTPAVSSSSDSGTAGAGCSSVAAGKAGDTCLKTIFLGASYRAGPAFIHGSWSQVKQPLATAGASTPSFTGAGFLAGTQFTLGGLNNDKVNVFDLGVNYALNSQLSLLTSVIQSRAKFVGAGDGKITQLSLGADYILSKRTDLYVFYANQKATDMYAPGTGVTGGPGADNSVNQIIVAMRHKF